MFFPIVVLLLLVGSPVQDHALYVGGPLEGFATLKECMAFAEVMAPRALMRQITKNPDADWVLHSVGCANNRAEDS